MVQAVTCCCHQRACNQICHVQCETQMSLTWSSWLAPSHLARPNPSQLLQQLTTCVAQAVQDCEAKLVRLQKIASERQAQREELQAEVLKLQDALSAAQVTVLPCSVGWQGRNCWPHCHAPELRAESLWRTCWPVMVNQGPAVCEDVTMGLHWLDRPAGHSKPYGMQDCT